MTSGGAAGEVASDVELVMNGLVGVPADDVGGG